MISFVFPGQGSQKKGMGGSLFDEFKEITEKADEILGYSIKKLCLEDPEMKLGQTQYTQVALYIVNALMYLEKIRDTGKRPDYVAGHSLGEYNALFAAGVFDFETGLKLVKKRGQLMGQATGGGMAAVIGMNEEQIKDVLVKNTLDKIDVANYNTPNQIVISGLKSEIEYAKVFFERAGALDYIILNVSGAFHSRYMGPAREEFESFLNQFTFSKPTIPVISNVSARPYKNSDIKTNMAAQITSSVRWCESIRYLMGKGKGEILQVGPGNVLTGHIRTILRNTEPLIVDESMDTENNEPDVCSSNNEGVKDSPEKVWAVEFSENKCVLPSTGTSSRSMIGISADSLGSKEFKKDFKLKYAYLTGGMYRGIASKDIIIKMGKSGMMGFLGTGGLDLCEVEAAIEYIQQELNKEEPYGINVVCNSVNPDNENRIIDLLLKYNVKNLEAAAYITATPALCLFRLKGMCRDNRGNLTAQNKIIAKVSRPEVAEVFMSPVPERISKGLLESQKITYEEYSISKNLPLADYICVEADSGGHTDQGVAYALVPAIQKLRDSIMEKYGYTKRIGIGAAGGIGTPEAAAAAFMLGADFVLTGSINQCTVEAGTSDAVKDLLQNINVQDTDYAPAGDMFELGAKVQVLKKGVFFPARANKLFELYRRYNSLDEIDEKTRIQLQEQYFHRSFSEVFEEVKVFYPQQEIERAESNPKQKMALIFKWYFGYSTRLALSGNQEHRVDYQVHCGPALGAFNQWVKGTELEKWRNRHVDRIGLMIMNEAAAFMGRYFQSITGL